MSKPDMPTKGAKEASYRPLADRLLRGLSVLCLAGLAVSLIVGLRAWQTDQLLPWEQDRFRWLLWATGGWLLLLAIITGSTMIRPSGRVPGPQPRSPRVRVVVLLLAALMLVFVVAYGWLVVARHNRFNSSAYDLAIHEQVVWNTLRGRFFASSLEVDNRFADHFSPFLLVPGAVYAVFPSPLTLVGLQAFVMALGMIPLYRIAQRKLSSKAVALALTSAYALYPAIGFILRFDFHTEALAVPAFLAAFDAMDLGKWRWASFWLVIPLLSKENMGLTVAAFGLYALLVHRKMSWGLIWVLVGLFTFGLTSFWLIPTVRGEGSDTLSRYRWLGDSPAEMITTFYSSSGEVWRHVAHPRRLLYLLQLLAPLGLLSLLAPLELALAGPGLLLNLLSDSEPQSAIYFQYTVPIVPFVFISAIVGAARLRSLLQNDWGWRLAGLALIPLCLAAFLIDSPFREQPALPPLWHEIDNADAVRSALQTVPETGSVVTTNAYAPHLAKRPGLFIIGIPTQRDAPLDPDVVFFNLHDEYWVPCDEYQVYLSQLDSQRYGITFQKEGVVVIEKDKGSNEEFVDLVTNWSGCAEAGSP